MGSIDLSGYETHFYCALCGGPFAKVFRTATARNHKHASEDLDVRNEFNVPEEENEVEFPEEVLEQRMGYAASRHRQHRIAQARKGLRRGIMSEIRQTRKAYDGRLISVKEMEWTRDLRALIHKNADHHPIEGQIFLQDNQAYLSGKGLIRQIEAWADAFASVELEDASELPVSGYQTHQFGFQVYQEFDRRDRNFVISSIPFHSSCWDILFIAIELSAKERGVGDKFVNDWLDGDEICDHIWGYLRGLVGVSGENNMIGNELHGDNRGDVVTRLGEVDYREAQGSGEGWQWRHDEGLHWIVADPDPSTNEISEKPLIKIGELGEISYSYEEPPALTCRIDPAPINNLPIEIVVMIFEYLTSTDIFSLRLASPLINLIEIPSWIYQKFVKEEFKYFPALTKEINIHTEGVKKALAVEERFQEYIDWKRSFERLRKLIRTPRNPADWDEVDINLKNRRRIWKIVKPMAEELVETTPIVLQHKYNTVERIAEDVSIVRGCVGTRSGKEGEYESAYFGPFSRKDENGDIEEVDVVLEKIRVWMSEPGREICGLDFHIYDEKENELVRKFGRSSTIHEDITIEAKNEEDEDPVIGFVFCFTEGVVGGIQIVYSDGSFSLRIGKWGGVVRKVVAPKEYRRMVGITGFVNSGGFIEKIGLLEEKLPAAMDEFGRKPNPPAQVPLSHDESTVWRRLPPADVRFLEREGLKIRNWRLHMAEWEVWVNGYEEEGFVGIPRQRRLVEIVGFYDNEFLRGIEFVYEMYPGGERFTSLMGASKSRWVSRLCLDPEEKISGVVLSFGAGGVHGILFVTNTGKTSDFFGPRYLGTTHKVFGPATQSSSTADRWDIQGYDSVIGLHCLFDHEVNRFLQLGLIFPVEENTLYGPEVPRPIPFDEVDDMGLKWEDGSPPKSLEVGQKPSSDLFSDISTGSKFCGWVDLSCPLKQVITYGRMAGIRFIFNDGSEKFFGNIYNTHDSQTQIFDGISGESITGAYAITERGRQEEAIGDMYENSTDIESVTTQRKTPEYMRSLWFLTNRNQHARPPNSEPLLVTNCLPGLKFEFNAKAIQAWLPIYHISSITEDRFPWCHLGYRADQQLSSSCIVAFDCFNESPEKRVDAVKGYITSERSFCGLLFRRNMEWDDTVFGQRSAFEITIELAETEFFTGAYFSGITALSLVTNTGKCTPWFGKPTKETEFRGPLSEWHEVVGIYGAIKQRRLDRVEWNVLGLLHRLLDEPQQPRVLSGIPLPMRCPEEDTMTGLPWVSDINSKRLDYELTTLASGRLNLYSEEAMKERPLKKFWRSYMSFEPGELEQFRVFVNRNPSYKSIRAVRLRGTKRMGLITMGQWPHGKDVSAIVKRDHKMNIQGQSGERITTLEVYLRCSETEDKLVGLVVETSWGRRKELYSYDERTEVDPRFGKLVMRRLECVEDREIVGFHGIVSNLQMHDIGLVTRPISGAFALPSTTVPATVRSLSGGDSSSKTSCHSVSDETACTEATVLSPEPTKLDELRCVHRN